MTDSYIYLITALLPLVASMLVFQVNPYHALVIRGILGAVAALLYTVLGAADVALTEALVGTLLAIMLYAVAVRSSMVLRLGVLKEAIATDNESPSPQINQFQQLIADLRTVFSKHHMRVEIIPYLEMEDLQQAFIDKQVHAICTHTKAADDEPRPYHTMTQLRRLYEIMQAGLATSPTRLSYVNASEAGKEQS
jgi:putative multicomponent Na+:H+ antiporter subunit B